MLMAQPLKHPQSESASKVPPHEGHNDCLLSTEIEVFPSVGTAVCTSTGEVGRGAIKVMVPSAVPCRLLGY